LAAIQPPGLLSDSVLAYVRVYFGLNFEHSSALSYFNVSLRPQHVREKPHSIMQAV